MYTWCLASHLRIMQTEDTLKRYKNHEQVHLQSRNMHRKKFSYKPSQVPILRFINSRLHSLFCLSFLSTIKLGNCQETQKDIQWTLFSTPCINSTLNNNLGELYTKGQPDDYQLNLINRIKAFSKAYSCKCTPQKMSTHVKAPLI